MKLSTTQSNLAPSDTILCSKCGAEVRLSEAVSHSIREQLAREFEIKRREHDAALAEREQKLATATVALEQQQSALQDEIERRLAAHKKDLLAQATRQAQDNLALEMKDLEARLAEQKQQLETARAAELNLRKRQRELDEKLHDFELESARRLDADRAKIREDAQKAAAESECLKLSVTGDRIAFSIIARTAESTFSSSTARVPK